jgi:hypothetical protein
LLLSEFGVDEGVVKKSLARPNEVYHNLLLGSAIALKRFNENVGIIIAFVRG